jgi:pilus assembly protein FimV
MEQRMSHGKTALTLMMALALPGAAQALGLGEIHVDSALNEPLAADIDIVGGTGEDLAGITASIADKETFQHFGVDRPAFLSTVGFKIARDNRGRAVLAIRSTDACTEPLLNILVDVRWGGGELIRQYTLLLDPPGFPSATPVAEAATGALATYTAPASVRPAASKALIETPKPAAAAPAPGKASTAAGGPTARKAIKVGAKATLRGVAWRVGSRSDADLKRMMIAIFHANPNAFEGNINRLRRGAVLTIPSAAEVSAISAANANHEVQAQMQAWHASALVSPTKFAAPVVATLISSPGESAGPAETALDRRVLQLERGLGELRDQLDREHAALVGAQARLSLAENAPAPAAATVAPPQVNSARGVGSSIAAILALAAGAFGLYIWRRRRALESRLAPADPKLQNLAAGEEATQTAVGETGTPSTPVPVEAREVGVEPRDVPHDTRDAPPATPLHAEADPSDGVDVEALEVSYLLQGSGGGLDDTVNLGDTDETAALPVTVKLRAAENTIPATKAGADAAKLDHNLLDLDATAQHVQMPSALNENAGFKERRTSLVDVLKRAVEREPHRRDLRMKLLETYYAAAATNRKGFLDTVQKIADERASLDEGEWDKIARMGRQIASDDDLFAPVAAQPDEEDLANCA